MSTYADSLAYCRVRAAECLREARLWEAEANGVAFALHKDQCPTYSEDMEEQRRCQLGFQRAKDQLTIQANLAEQQTAQADNRRGHMNPHDTEAEREKPLHGSATGPVPLTKEAS